MKKQTKIIVILLAVFLELAWAFWPHLSHGSVLEEPYRHDERMATLVAQMKNPTPETKAAYDAEVELLDKHIARRAVTILTVGLAINIFGIYLFWRFAPTKTAV